jgi:hypothetical protein
MIVTNTYLYYTLKKCNIFLFCYNLFYQNTNNTNICPITLSKINYILYLFITHFVYMGSQLVYFLFTLGKINHTINLYYSLHQALNSYIFSITRKSNILQYQGSVILL